MKRLFFLLVLLPVIFSCTNQVKFPEYITLPADQGDAVFSVETEKWLNPGNSQSEKDAVYSAFLDSLQAYRQMYLQKDERFDFTQMQLLWQELKNRPEMEQLSGEAARQWFSVSGFLFQLTANVQYISEMERLLAAGLSDNQDVLNSLVAPYVYTRDVDHIHVNFFLPSEISYEHSLDGAVKITQITDYPESGRIRLNFSMEIKRYIEVFVRIPSWAEGASVMVKGVKYFTHPGSYCFIAKKWKEGDVVEIEFPMENLPDYLKNNI